MPIGSTAAASPTAGGGGSSGGPGRGEPSQPTPREAPQPPLPPLTSPPPPPSPVSIPSTRCAVHSEDVGLGGRGSAGERGRGLLPAVHLERVTDDHPHRRVVVGRAVAAEAATERGGCVRRACERRGRQRYEDGRGGWLLPFPLGAWQTVAGRRSRRPARGAACFWVWVEVARKRRKVAGQYRPPAAMLPVPPPPPRPPLAPPVGILSAVSPRCPRCTARDAALSLLIYAHAIPPGMKDAGAGAGRSPADGASPPLVSWCTAPLHLPSREGGSASGGV